MGQNAVKHVSETDYTVRGAQLRSLLFSMNVKSLGAMTNALAAGAFRMEKGGSESIGGRGAGGLKKELQGPSHSNGTALGVAAVNLCCGVNVQQRLLVSQHVAQNDERVTAIIIRYREERGHLYGDYFAAENVTGGGFATLGIPKAPNCLTHT